MIIPYSIASYKRADLPRIRLTNQFVEKTPASAAQVALLPRPGLVTYSDIGDGPIRGVFSQPGALEGALFSLSGTDLYNGPTLIGTIPGLDRVNMAGTLNTMLIANDTGLFRTDGATVISVGLPTLPVARPTGATSVGFINGYSFATHTDTRRLYYTLDPAVWDDLDYVSAETSTGNIVAAVVVSDQIWVFCEKVTEIFVTTGDAQVPFRRVEGRLYDKGCISRDTIVKMDNSIVWVGHDGIVYRGDSVPTRISDHGIEERIQSSAVADLRAWSFAWVGHLFYILSTTDGTFAFDAATQQWTEFTSYQRTVWRAHLGTTFDGLVIAGDDQLGRLWKLDGFALLDGGDPVERRHTVLIDQRSYCHNIVLNASSGSIPEYGVDPVIEVRLSRDQGQTWGAWRQAPLGRRGEYRQRIAWRRFGMIDGEGGVLDFRVTDPAPWRLSDVRINEAFTGRSR